MAGEQSRKLLLWICAVAQAAAVGVTWPLWQSRESQPNLPLVEMLSAVPFGWIMLATLLVVVVRPALGLPAHAVCLGLAIAGDQFRLQPQFFGLAILMWGCISETGARVCRWYLVAMWLWAGMHKGLSPDWWGHRSWNLVSRAGLEPESFSLAFALVTVVAEIALGLLAIWRPKLAAPVCVIAHLGIVIFLSPLFAGWNYSVIPWNICTAIVGASVLRRSIGGWPATRSESWIAAALLIYPLGFYSGWVDRSLSHVLYSDNLPRGLITSGDTITEIDGWGRLGVPFPSQQRLLQQYFQLVGGLGATLHVLEPRWGLADRFFVLDENRVSMEIRSESFYNKEKGDGALHGIGLDDRRAVFALTRAGVRLLKRAEGQMVYAAEFTPASFDPLVLRWLVGLPNLEQLQFQGCPIEERDLKFVEGIKSLTGIGIEGTRISRAGFERLQSMPNLKLIESDFN